VRTLWAAVQEGVHDEDGAVRLEGLDTLLTCDVPVPEDVPA
jgi:hypothetical protein